MYGRGGLDRFKKAQSLEPFSVSLNSAPQTIPKVVQVQQHSHSQNAVAQLQQEEHTQSQPATQLGGGQSTWQPPDWAIEPRPGVYYLKVLKEGQVLDHINLDRRRHIFGRQYHTCDFVLDHQSVSRQHAAVIPHKNGSIYVIDLGSAHGTFVANERLMKDAPVELEVGQSLRFAASTRTYILRKNNAALFPHPPPPTGINLPPVPDPSDEEAVVAYNTLINRYVLSKSDLLQKSDVSTVSLAVREDSTEPDRATKRMRKVKATFKDQAGGELVEVVGISDGADVETEPGPVGVKEGSLVGKYESLVQTTVIPKGKNPSSVMEDNVFQKGVTDKLQEVLNKVKKAPKDGIYDDLYGESLSDKVGSSWAYASVSSAGRQGFSFSYK
ncbi:nuclear inhibitor of protein phosphatase 1-like isoform X1 [Durio zibethinus]|uniref:Nuclear inhibitor of protein phosphatase 1-like isoform X1 n=1 Tax=Durio zibethinus TaxID=66656 RepID=A0A6P5WKJ5_DURZI|nr:nuclear inhibitor of protein phosphatase 1-like isoform X1 [Durio zibethinus]XP_022716282.1 nuclear inhibitor of protein phosphatase 1-like isoform X1 [Durio zibethinus]XP_022716283.1 nuclear inhibitor of protein phosphatase 1-like isoform X1 [Durio zibethinus]